MRELPTQVILKYPAVFLAALGLTYALTPLCGKLAVALGLVDRPGGRRQHPGQVPRGGGLAVFLGFHVGCAVVFLLPWRAFGGQLDARWWWAFLFLSGLLMCFGLVDDRWEVRPWTKLLGQTVVALLAFGLDMRVGRLVGVAPPAWVDGLFTVLWFLAIVNAFNLIDGLDGLAAGLACIAAAGMCGALLIRHQPADAMVLLALLGCSLAFLRYNYHPASIFLGDAGSTFLGFALAAVAVSSGVKGTAVAAIGMPLLAVGIPLFDIFLAIWRRTIRGYLSRRAAVAGGENGVHVFRADTDHLHHRLRQAGLSQPTAAIVLYGVAFALVAVGLLSLWMESHALGIYILAFVAGTYVVVRHVARVELWDSGTAILHGLSRPSRKVVAVLMYVPLDILILGVALSASVVAAGPDREFRALKLEWLELSPVWVGVPFLALCAMNTYRRVWSRARVSEYVGLSFGLLAAIVATAGVSDLLGAFPDAELFSRTLVFSAVALPAATGVRAFRRAVQDAMARMRRRTPAAPGHAPRNVVIYGAGYRCTLLLRAMSFSLADGGADQHVVGLLDDDPNLRGRLVHGHRVFGGMETVVPEFLRSRQIDEIIVAAPLDEQTTRRLMAAAGDVRVSEWRIERRLVGNPGPPSAAGSDPGQGSSDPRQGDGGGAAAVSSRTDRRTVSRNSV
jgi:UDP-N-acetylmuramyl pentapeptide phosphotransferase/UDP-N-acetylglucosamine-1-phosphate transferase